MSDNPMEIDATHLHELDRVDNATADLILQLHSRDIEELLDACKGKGRDGESSDADLAIATYEKELQERMTILADQNMARSLTQAVISDAALLRKSLAEENTAMEDRAVAHCLVGIQAPPAAPVQKIGGSTLDDDFLVKLAVLYVSGRNDESTTSKNTTNANSSGAAESSVWAASRQTPSMASTSPASEQRARCAAHTPARFAGVMPTTAIAQRTQRPNKSSRRHGNKGGSVATIAGGSLSLTWGAIIWSVPAVHNSAIAAGSAGRPAVVSSGTKIALRPEQIK
ncbi:hypothetical protein MMC08_005943 [Hypocenomyce scalaris]|nr:hypothetical protein [Hypocenomyce scalaris]